MESSGGDISRENLKRHGIIYDAEAYICDPEGVDASSNVRSSLPDHVDALREALLAFSGIIPDEWKDTFDNEFRLYGSEIPERKEFLLPSAVASFTTPRYKFRYQSEAAHKNNESCEKVAYNARIHAKEAEAGWSHFFRNNIFKKFDEAKNSRTEISLMFDQWSLQENVQWNACQAWQESIPDTKRRTDPKPDLAYGFQIIPSPKTPPKGFARDEYIQSFSLSVLGTLYSNGVYSTTTTGLQRWTGTKKDDDMKAPDLLCYPWAIVEMKPCHASPSEVEKCYCQAANASAAALSLQEQLFVPAFGTIPTKLPPIIAFTCIGPRIKVWLTYRWETSRESFTKMSCIWSTSLELTWGVVVIRSIMKTMHFWSSRILKPKIATAVRLVREKLDTAVPPIMGTPQNRGFISSSTPTTPRSSRNRQGGRHRSLSGQSRPADRSNTDVNAASVDSGPESSGAKDDSGEEKDNNYWNDESHSSDTESTTNRSEGVAFNDLVFSSDDESKYTPSGTCETESDDENYSGLGDDSCTQKIDFKYADEELEDRRRLSHPLLSGVKFAKLDIHDKWFEDLPFEQYVRGYSPSGTCETESDDENYSGSGDDSFKQKIGFKYTDEELEDRRRLSLSLLSGVKFAKLDVLDEWFENLPFEEQVNVIWKLMDPSNGGLLFSTHIGWKKNRLQHLIDTLNEAQGKDEFDETALTTKDLGYKTWGPRIRRSLRSLYWYPEVLKGCLYDCLCLHNDKTYSVFEILSHDLQTLSDEELEEMGEQGFQLLNKGDQETNLLR